MGRRFLIWVVMSLLLLTPPALAASTTETAPTRPAAGQASTPPIALTRLTYPKQVKAGQSITFQVEGTADGGLCCGLMGIKGPSGQWLDVELFPTETGSLSGTLRLNAHLEPGTWTITSLRLRSNRWEMVELPGGTPWKESFTVTSSGKVKDNQGPTFLGLEVPESALGGELYEIKVRAKDNLSGLDAGFATIEPVMPTVTEGPAMKPSWSHTIKLRPGANPGELVGSMVMDPFYRHHGLQVVTVALGDKAGNGTVVNQQQLTDLQLRRETDVKRHTVPEGLLTSPYLNLIHPGQLSYQFWYVEDESYLSSGLVPQIRTDRQAARERLLAELSQLRAALDGVRAEIYTDPESGLRVVPFATTGKWMALNQAILHRVYLLTFTSASSKPLEPADVESLQKTVRESYQLVRRGDRLLRLDEGYNTSLAQISASYLHQLASSPAVVAAMKSRAYQEADYIRADEFDLDLIYFVPAETDSAYPKIPGGPILQIPVRTSTPMAGTLGGLYYQLGLHLGEAYFSSSLDQNRAEWWAPYLELRGGPGWSEEDLRETPAANFAIDFAQAFLPGNLDFALPRSVPSLTSDPEMQERFRTWVEEMLKVEPSAIALSTRGSLQIGLADRLSVAVTAPGGESSMTMLRKAYGTEALNKPASGGLTADRRGTLYTSLPQEMGEPYWHLLTVTDSDWRRQFHVYTYIQAPVLLDPLPAGTNKGTVTITGTAQPGKTVTVGTRSVKAGKDGRFAITASLKPGENILRVTAAGAPLGARVRIIYQPAGKEIPAEWTVPASTTKRYLFFTLKTIPYALVRMEGKLEQADSRGHLFLVKRLEPGENLVRFEVTDRYGNTSVQEAKVVYTP
ncbi:MAG: hypothetical protein ACOY93_21305 [Bacillota bacterium]